MVYTLVRVVIRCTRGVEFWITGVCHRVWRITSCFRFGSTYGTGLSCKTYEFRDFGICGV